MPQTKSPTHPSPYATSNEALGISPQAFRAGGAGQDIKLATAECSLGALLVAASDKGVCAILFGNGPQDLRKELKRQFPKARLIEGDADFESVAAEVARFVENPHTELDLPLDIRGTAFQHLVWDALRRIPAGSTASYAEIARRIGAPGSARAVARACASNLIAVAIPCHRAVRSDGSISGYRGGVARKRALLAKEAKS